MERQPGRLTVEDGLTSTERYPEIIDERRWHRLVRLTHKRAVDANPTWSPDGTTIAFEHRDGPANLDIYGMDADGTDVRRLTTSSGSDSSPACPGRNKNAREHRDGNFDIYVMNADGSGQNGDADAHAMASRQAVRRLVFQQPHGPGRTT